MSHSGWKPVFLGDVASFASGRTPLRARHAEYFHRGTIPWVKTLDLNNSGILTTDESVTPRALADTGMKVLPKGTVLVAMYGGFNQIGRTGVLRTGAVTNQAITAIRPNALELDSDFLLHLLNYRVSYWRSVASSSRKDPNITKGDIKAFPMRLPPVTEQRRIACALNDADLTIEALAALIAKKQVFKQAMMQQLLTGRTRLPGFAQEWRTCTLGEVLTVRHGKSQRGVEVSSGKYPILATGGQIGWARTPLYTKPSVLIGRKGTIDRPQYQDHPFWTVDTLFYTEIAVSADPRFLYYVFLTVDWSSMNEASGVPSLSSSRIEGVEVQLPEKAEQIAIRQVLDDAGAEIDELLERIKKAQAIKTGMMQQLLTGRVRLPVETAS